jgi:hypothetical protein
VRSSIERRIAVSAIAAVGLCLVLVSQTLAVAWSEPVAVTSARNAYVFGEDLQATGDNSAVALYGLRKDDGSDSVQMRRTWDGGRTWSRRTELAAQGYGLLAGVGRMLDVVLVVNGRVRYQRSDDGGRTLGAASTLSPRHRLAYDVSAVHHGNGFVGIAWVGYNRDLATYGVFLRRSLDNGKTFMPVQAIADTGTDFNPLQLAVGDGVVYLGYIDAQYRLRIKRSFDWGAQWTPGIVVASRTDEFELAADGDEAYVTYPHSFVEQNYIHSTDRGSSWSSARSLTPDGWSSSNVKLVFDDGVLRAALTRCNNSGDICQAGDVYYRRTSDGVTWSKPQLVSPDCRYQDALADGIAYPGHVLILYEGISCTGRQDWEVFARRGG